MKRLTDCQIKNRLDKIADLTDEITIELKARSGSGFVYFEAEGRAHAMKNYPESGEPSVDEDILVSSRFFTFDCGAW